jgi:hypothetical protein
MVPVQKVPGVLLGTLEKYFKDLFTDNVWFISILFYLSFIMTDHYNK